MQRTTLRAAVMPSVLKSLLQLVATEARIEFRFEYPEGPFFK